MTNPPDLDRLLMLKIRGFWYLGDPDSLTQKCAEKLDPLIPLPAAALRSLTGRGEGHESTSLHGGLLVRSFGFA